MFQITLIPSNPSLDGAIIYVREPITALEYFKWHFLPSRDIGTDIVVEKVPSDTYVHPDDCRDTFDEWLEEWN